MWTRLALVSARGHDANSPVARPSARLPMAAGGGGGSRGAGNGVGMRILMRVATVTLWAISSCRPVSGSQQLNLEC